MKNEAIIDGIVVSGQPDAADLCQGGTRAAVAVAIVLAERAGQGADDVVKMVAAAGFELRGRPYEAFIRQHFARGERASV